MLSQNQVKYLQTIPEEKTILVQPFDPKVKDVSKEIIRKINLELQELVVSFGGSAALGIAGQNDIDINLLSIPEEYDRYLPGLIRLCGKPTKQTPNLVTWKFTKNGFAVELYSTDRNSQDLKEQIKTFEIIRDNPAYKKQYEQIKVASNGQSFREYIRRKYEFFNKILELS